MLSGLFYAGYCTFFLIQIYYNPLLLNLFFAAVLRNSVPAIEKALARKLGTIINVTPPQGLNTSDTINFLCDHAISKILNRWNVMDNEANEKLWVKKIAFNEAVPFLVRLTSISLPYDRLLIL
jgi:hypothetical protein